MDHVKEQEKLYELSQRLATVGHEYILLKNGKASTQEKALAFNGKVLDVIGMLLEEMEPETAIKFMLWNDEEISNHKKNILERFNKTLQVE